MFLAILSSVLQKVVYYQNDISEKGLIFSRVHLLMQVDLLTTVLYQMELPRGLHLGDP